MTLHLYKMTMFVSKIISGGQTGVDRGAIEAALESSFYYGGLIPSGRLAEDGIVPLKFNLMEESLRRDYLYRTEYNVKNSDATLIITDTIPPTGGTKRTVDFCEKHKRPYKMILFPIEKPLVTMLEVKNWVEDVSENILHHDQLILNVAGPRESKVQGIQEATKDLIKRMIISWRTIHDLENEIDRDLRDEAND